MTDYQKGMIDAYHDVGISSTVIGKKLGRSSSTIRTYLAKREQYGYRTRKRTGRPQKLSQWTIRQLMRSVKLDNKQKYITLRNNIAPQVSIRTIRRRLRERNMRKWLAAGRPKLTEEHARKRLEWAKCYKDFTPEDWLKVA